MGDGSVDSSFQSDQDDSDLEETGKECKIDGVCTRDSLVGLVTPAEHAPASTDTFQTSTRQALVTSKMW